MMGEKNLRVFGSPGATIRFPTSKKGDTGDYDGRQERASSLDTQHHHPAPKLQEWRQEEVMMGDKNL